MSKLNSKKTLSTHSKNKNKIINTAEKTNESIDLKNDEKNDLKTCILSSAAALFSKLGLDKTSTRDISKQSKANISMISYHFGGKEGLYKEVIKEFAYQVEQKAQSQIEGFQSIDLTIESFKHEIEVIIRTMVSMRMEHSEICKILSREKIEGMPLSKEVHERVFYPLILHFYELFKKAQSKKLVRKDIDPALFFILISEGIWGFFEITECDIQMSQDVQSYKNDPEKLITQIKNIVLTGVII